LKIERDGSTSILRISSVTQRDCGEIRCIAAITRGPSISSSTQLRLKSSSPSKICDNILKSLEPRSRSLPRLKNRCTRKSNRLSTPNLHVDKKSVEPNNQVSSFTRLASKKQYSSDEYICEKYSFANKLANGQTRAKSVDKIPKEEKATRKRLYLEKNRFNEYPMKKLDSTSRDFIEINIKDVEKVHLKKEVVEKKHMPSNMRVDANEIDKTIVQILAKENIIIPIKSKVSEERILATKEKKLPKSVSAIKEMSKERLSIKRISSFKNSQCNSTLDIVACEINTHQNNNNNNNNNNEKHSDKEMTIKMGRNLSALPPVKIHDIQHDRMTSLAKQQMGIFVNRKDVPALVLRPPDDVITLRGSTIVLEVAYQGHPDPNVKWMRAVSYLQII
jgi:molybdopterin converting factor small subunit